MGQWVYSRYIGRKEHQPPLYYRGRFWVSKKKGRIFIFVMKIAIFGKESRKYWLSLFLIMQIETTVLPSKVFVSYQLIIVVTLLLVSELLGKTFFQSLLNLKESVVAIYLIFLLALSQTVPVSLAWISDWVGSMGLQR